MFQVPGSKFSSSLLGTLNLELGIFSLMLVAKYYHNNDIRLEDMPIPKIKPGEILVKVRASGICGTIP